MFVETRIWRGKKKYYLVHSYREGGTTKKIRVYLGLELDNKALKEKKEEARKRILVLIDLSKRTHNPYETVLLKEEIEALRSLEPKGKIKLMHLSEKDWLKFTEAFTYDTNAIEGSTVELAEVKGILEDNNWPDKSRDEISETFGVAEAVNYIRKTKVHLSMKLILALHAMVFRNSKPFAGTIRKPGEEVAVMDRYRNIVHRGAVSIEVPAQLKELIRWYKKYKAIYPPLVLAAVVHNQFETIHPFIDGNGRVGRLLLVNILLKHKLPPVNIELKNRSEYYAALQAYQKGGNIRPTIDLLLKEYKKLRRLLKG